MTEEELNDLKSNNLIHSDKDKRHYEMLYKKLAEKDNSFDLSSKFQLKLNSVLAKRKREERFEKVILFSGVVVMFFATLITLAITGAFENVNLFGSIYWYVIIFFVMVWSFRRIEKKYLKTT